MTVLDTNLRDFRTKVHDLKTNKNKQKKTKILHSIILLSHLMFFLHKDLNAKLGLGMSTSFLHQVSHLSLQPHYHQSLASLGSVDSWECLPPPVIQ